MINCTVPEVMGIINLSPDSFSAVGRVNSPEQALVRAAQCSAEGAASVDLGAEATNPKQDNLQLPLQQELDRLIPAVERIASQLDLTISVDTSKPEVMRAAVAAGAHRINDQRALRSEGALQTVADLKVPVCLMHMRFPSGQPTPTCYDYPLGVVSEVLSFLKGRMSACLAAGIERSHLWVDPGFGFGSFGKTTEHNLQLLQHLSVFKTLGAPLLVGVSRKTFIGKIVDKPTEQRLAGSLAVATLAWLNGARIVRTHDVAETVDTLKIVTRMQEIDG